MMKIDRQIFSARNITIASVAIILIFLALKLWDFFHAKKPPIPARPVQTAVAVKREASIYIDSFGSLTPLYDVNIKSQVGGEIKGVHFTEGQDVAKGDLLFTIDQRSYESELDKAQAQVAQDVADLNMKKSTLARNEKLLADKLVSQQDFDKYQTDVDAADARRKLDVAAVAIAKINLDYCAIKSPIDGRAGKRQVDPGNIITANTGPTLVNIKTIDPIRLDFTIPEVDLPALRDAMAAGKLTVEFNVQGDETSTYTSTVQFIDNAVDKTTGTVAIRALADNKERKLWPGQFATIRLILGAIKDATVVTYEAVQIGQKGPYAFVVTADKKAELRPVKTGNRQGTDIVILSGIEPGERVVTAGQMGLAPGAPVIDLTEEKGASAKTLSGQGKKTAGAGT